MATIDNFLKLDIRVGQIGPFVSETLTLGVPDEDHEVVLVKPDIDVPLGGKLF